MGWNNSKFKELRIGINRNLEDCLLFTPGHENVLVPEQNVKDLGVLIDYRLSFKDQRDRVLKKARNKTSWVLRTFKSRNLKIMRRLWRSIIHYTAPFGLCLFALEPSG